MTSKKERIDLEDGIESFVKILSITSVRRVNTFF